MTNLSADGIGLFVREPLPPGQHVAVQFPLPGAKTAERVTATGVVRWSHTVSAGRWHPVGLAWLPLEDAARRGIAASLDRRIGGRDAAGPFSVGVRRLLWAALIALGALVAVRAGARLRSLDRENSALRQTMQQRDQMIAQLERRGSALKQALTLESAQLTQTKGAVAALDQQTQRLERRMAQLTQDVARAQASSAQVRDERDALMQRVLDMEQEQVMLKRRLSSIPELRAAMQATMAVRRREQRIVRQLPHATTQTPEPWRLVGGNRGYLLQRGRPTAGGSTVWIRVHEPQPSLADTTEPQNDHRGTE